MALTQALSIYTSESAKADLRNVIVGVFENMGKSAISQRLKSRNYAEKAGSFEFKRFANATVSNYGTARTAGKGNKIVAPPIIVNLDQNKEIVEEVNFFDSESFTGENFNAFLERRKMNISLSVQRQLDRDFFAAVKTGGTAANIQIDTASKLIPQFEDVILKLETTSNNYVDGVDRQYMALILSPELYGKVKTELNDCYNFAGTVADEVFKGINGVAAFSSNRLPSGVDYEIMTMDSVAQPVMLTDVGVEKIQLSNEYAAEVFFRYGTKVLAPELALYGAKKSAS